MKRNILALALWLMTSAGHAASAQAPPAIYAGAVSAAMAARGIAAAPPSHPQVDARVTPEAEALIRRFELTTGDKARQAVAVEISENYRARLQLKQPDYEALGRQYYRLIKGNRDSLTAQMIERAQAKLSANWDASLLARIGSIENEASRLAEKAPMDLDVGVTARNSKEAADLRNLIVRKKDRLRGNRAIVEFTADLERELKAAYVEIAGELGNKTVDVSKVHITGTTPWHPEAYLASEVLKQGGVAPTSLVQQTCDVTRYKISQLKELYLSARTPNEAAEAIVEAARAITKDLAKVDATFAFVGARTGVAPALSPANLNVRKMLQEIVDGRIRPTQAGAGFFDAGLRLIDNMESALVLANPAPLLKVRLYATYLLPEAARGATVAVANNDLLALPPAAIELDAKLARVAGVRLVSIRPDAPREFLTRVLARWKDIPFQPTDETLATILSRLDALPDDDLALLVGREHAAPLIRARGLLSAPTRERLYQWMLKGGTLELVDGKTTELVAAAGPRESAFSADRALLFGAAIVSLATGLSETGAIMDRGLPPDEQTRQILTAWVRAMPMLGDFCEGVAKGLQFWYVTGDSADLAQAALAIAMGASWLVQAVMVPTLVATLGMAAASAASSSYAAYQDRVLIDAWVESGVWDTQQGLLLGILDSTGSTRAVRPDERALADLYVNGDVPYHWAIGSVTPSIRESLLDYLDRAGFARDVRVEASLTALKNAYPTFDVAASLRKPAKVGRVDLVTLIKSKGDDPFRTPALGVYIKLEEMYERGIKEAIGAVKADAEKEFQAEHMVGTARDAFEALARLEQRLAGHPPLTSRVKDVETASFTALVETLKTPWEKHGVKARVIDRVVKWVDGYTRVAESIDRIGQICKRAGVNPPTQFNLTGYLSVDGVRMADLETAYANALRQAEEDADTLAALAKVADRRTNPCATQVTTELARLALAQVLSRDWALLAAQWSGRASAAAKSRDESLQRARDFIDRKAPLPQALWQVLSNAYEDAYAWAKAPEAWSGSDFSELQKVATERNAKLAAEYEAARVAGRQQLASGCQTEPTPEPQAPDDPAALCACVTRWQQTIQQAQWLQECKKIGPPACVDVEVRIIKPWTYDPEKKLCGGSFEDWKASTDWIPQTPEDKDLWPWVRVGTAHNQTVSLEQARKRCVELDKAGIAREPR